MKKVMLFVLVFLVLAMNVMAVSLSDNCYVADSCTASDATMGYMREDNSHFFTSDSSFFGAEFPYEAIKTLF